MIFVISNFRRLNFPKIVVFAIRKKYLLLQLTNELWTEQLLQQRTSDVAISNEQPAILQWVASKFSKE